MPVIKDATTPYITKAGPQPGITAVSTPYIKSVNTYAIPPSLQDKFSAYWKAETFVDEVANLTLAPVVDPPTILPAKVNNGWRMLKAEVEFLRVADTAAISPSGQFAIGFWLNPLEFTGTQGLVTKGSTGAANLSYAVLLTSGQQVQFQTSNGSTVTAFNSNEFVSVLTWHHIYVQHDGENMGISVDNGTLKTVAAAQQQANAANFEVGVWGGSATYKLGGVVDEVFFVNGEVLTTDDRDTIYNSGVGTTWEDLA